MQSIVYHRDFFFFFLSNTRCISAITVLVFQHRASNITRTVDRAHTFLYAVHNIENSLKNLRILYCILYLLTVTKTCMQRRLPSGKVAMANKKIKKTLLQFLCQQGTCQLFQLCQSDKYITCEVLFMSMANEQTLNMTE